MGARQHRIMRDNALSEDARADAGTLDDVQVSVNAPHIEPPKPRCRSETEHGLPACASGLGMKAHHVLLPRGETCDVGSGQVNTVPHANQFSAGQGLSQLGRPDVPPLEIGQTFKVGHRRIHSAGPALRVLPRVRAGSSLSVGYVLHGASLPPTASRPGRQTQSVDKPAGRRKNQSEDRAAGGRAATGRDRAASAGTPRQPDPPELSRPPAISGVHGDFGWSRREHGAGAGGDGW